MRKTLVAMWIGILFLVVSWLFPPTLVRKANATFPTLRDYDYMGQGFALFLSDECDPQYPKLAVINAVIVVLTAGAMVTLSKK